jgi:spore coat protein U-like protein
MMEITGYLRAISGIQLDYFSSLFEVTKWVKSMKYALFSFTLGFLTAGLAPRPALAATSNASFAVTVTVQAGCQVSAPATASGINTPAGANSTPAVSVACTIPTPYNVSQSAARTTGVTGMMTGQASALLDHSLLPQSAHTTKWGRMAETHTVAGTGTGSIQPDAVLVRTGGAEFVAPGVYADTITTTVTY